MSISDLSKEHIQAILDGTKISWYKDRVDAWERGERIAPVTIDMALTTHCNLGCEFCYRYLQKNDYYKITKDHMTDFLDDCKEIGVKGVSLVSDGESSISTAYRHTIEYGHSLGLSMASGTNAYLLKGDLLEAVFPKLTYLRVNISGGQEDRYNEIMGAKGDAFKQVCENIKSMMAMKKAGKSNCTVGMQMVFKPDYEDQLIPLAQLAIDLGAEYLIIKHCSDDEFGTLGVKYGDYEATYPTLRKAEAMSTEKTLVKVKWSKIMECGETGAIRTYTNCYGTPFLLQISGTGLVAPCGMMFNERYKSWAHIGNITESRFKDIWQSDKYWAVVDHLANRKSIPGAPLFNAQTSCGTLCLQHSCNRALDNHIKGIKKIIPEYGDISHKEFV